MEADLIIEGAGRLTIVEAKAGQTTTGEMFASARRVRAVLDAVAPTQAFVVYAGDAPQKRGEIKLLPWAALHGQTWT